jgi:hypothetical protein
MHFNFLIFNFDIHLKEYLILTLDYNKIAKKNTSNSY